MVLIPRTRGKMKGILKLKRRGVKDANKDGEEHPIFVLPCHL